jgi:hypothetical protein
MFKSMINTSQKNREELLSDLQTKGEVSFVFFEKNKRRLKKAFDRSIKAEQLLRNKSKLSRLHFLIYGTYNMAREFLSPTKDEGYTLALIFFQTSWMYISHYEGQSLEKGKAKVTFYART